MGWIAGHIIAQPQSSIVTTFASAPALAGHLYHITDLKDVQWSPGAKRHDFSPEGLLIIRDVLPAPLCGPDDIDWGTISGPPDLPILLPDDYHQHCSPQSDFDDFKWYPPLGCLRFLKQVSAATQVPVSFYGCRIVGEHRFNYAWGFCSEESVYVSQGPFDRLIAHRSHGQHIERQLIAEDVVVRTFQHHNIHLP